jgi:hypothetical protein
MDKRSTLGEWPIGNKEGYAGFFFEGNAPVNRPPGVDWIGIEGPCE